MMDIALTNDGDADLNSSSGDFNTIDGQDQLAQKIQISLGTNLGELAWHLEFGLNHPDVEDNMWDPSYVQTLIDDYLTETFEEVGDVEIVNTQYNNETRHYTMRLNITLNSGEQLTMTSEIGGDNFELVG